MYVCLVLVLVRSEMMYRCIVLFYNCLICLLCGYFASSSFLNHCKVCESWVELSWRWNCNCQINRNTSSISAVHLHLWFECDHFGESVDFLSASCAADSISKPLGDQLVYFKHFPEGFKVLLVTYFIVDIIFLFLLFSVSVSFSAIPISYFVTREINLEK